MPAQIFQLLNLQPIPFIWASIMGVILGLIFLNYNKNEKSNVAFGSGLVIGFLIFYFVVNQQDKWLVRDNWPFVVGISIFIGLCSPYKKDRGQHEDKFQAMLIGFTITMFVCFLVLDKLLLA